jgi:Ca2+-binding EF-hand superfamily protein
MLNKIRIALALSGTLIAGAATVAMAHPSGSDSGPDKGDVMQKFDTNKDGKLDDKEREAMRAEFKAKHAAMKAEMLAKFDTNKDGKLDDAERKVMRDARAAETFKKLDTDGNGVLSLDEFKAAQGKLGHQGRFGKGHDRGRGHGGRDND